MNTSSFLSQMSEPTHYSGAQYALAYGLVALAVLAGYLAHRALARRPKVRRPLPLTSEQQRQRDMAEYEAEYQRRCRRVNEELLAGRLTPDEAHLEWRRAKDDFFDVLAANGFPQPGHRRTT